MIAMVLRLTAIAALAAAPSAARADAGTPMMWAGMLHLTVLNAGIGLLEAALLTRCFGAPRLRARSWMIAANYVSMIAGAIAMAPLWAALDRMAPGGAPLMRAPEMLGQALATSFALTVLVEWPFCAAALLRVRPGPLVALRASLLAQTASYALLVPYYLLASPISMLTATRIERTPAFAAGSPAMVYYIDPADGDIWRIGVDGTRRAKVRALGARDEDTRLEVEDGPVPRPCDVGIAAWPDRADGGRFVAGEPVLPRLGEGCAAGANSRRPTWFNFGSAADLRSEHDRGWMVRTGFWAAEGISLSAPDGGGYRLALETPFAAWICRSASVLPGDLAVFQLGTGQATQIVVLHIPTRRLAVLVRGRGPVVILHPR